MSHKHNRKLSKIFVAAQAPDTENRAIADFYRTPEAGVARFLDAERFPGMVVRSIGGEL